VKINMPWKVLKMVKRYAKTTDDSLMKNKPNDQVRPKRHSRAKPPMTHDLEEQKKKKKRETMRHERGTFSSSREQKKSLQHCILQH